jgi:hypothetical protein
VNESEDLVKYQVNNHATMQGQTIGDHNKEASQSGQQQQCILSGEVHLRHRLKDNFCLSYHQSIAQQQKACNLGVLACWRCKKLSLSRKCQVKPGNFFSSTTVTSTEASRETFL